MAWAVLSTATDAITSFRLKCGSYATFGPGPIWTFTGGHDGECSLLIGHACFTSNRMELRYWGDCRDRPLPGECARCGGHHRTEDC